MSIQLIDPKQLKKIRVQVGHTQAELARLAGVSQSIVAKLEAGTVDPTFSTLKALSSVLNSSLATIGKKAQDVMTSPVIGVQDDEKLSGCVAIMKKNSISQMPVMARRKMVGTISEGQIMDLVASSEDPSAVLEQKVRAHVLPAFAVVGRDTPVDALISLFQVLPAVLVSSEEGVEGIITKIDVLVGASQNPRTKVNATQPEFRRRS
ncbi:MAG: helix-turn-helix domain-containing protein [Thaumarchaeota archaeon]|nr:helix-turn-helix domain-containing protein [Nitrososphaerota archaeon]